MHRTSAALVVSALFLAPGIPALADQRVDVAQEQQADEPGPYESGGESDQEYAPEDRPGGYGESEPVTNDDIQVEDMDKTPSTPPDPEERKDEPKGDIEPRQRQEAEEKPWYRFWE